MPYNIGGGTGMAREPLHLCQKCGSHGWVNLPGLPPIDVRSKGEAKFLITQNKSLLAGFNEGEVNISIHNSRLPLRPRRHIHCREYGRDRRELLRAMKHHTQRFEKLRAVLGALDMASGRLTNAAFKPVSGEQATEAELLQLGVAAGNINPAEA